VNTPYFLAGTCNARIISDWRLRLRSRLRLLTNRKEIAGQQVLSDWSKNANANLQLLMWYRHNRYVEFAMIFSRVHKLKTRTCVRSYTHSHIHTHTYTRTCIYIYIYIYIYICACTCTHDLKINNVLCKLINVSYPGFVLPLKKLFTS